MEETLQHSANKTVYSMNILHINTTTEWRGGDMQMLTTYKLLKDHNDITQFIFCPLNSKISQELTAQHVPHETIDQKYKISFRYFKKILQIAKTKNIHILHAHDSYALTIATAVSFFCTNIKVVYSRKRNNKIKNNIIKKIKFNAKSIAKIVCVSAAVKEVLDPILKDKNKATVIYDGIDIGRFAAQANENILRNEFCLDGNTIIIGNIAALTPQKDLITFIDAAEVIIKRSNKKIIFFIVGDGDLKNTLVEYTKTKEINSYFIFTGFRDDIPKILPEFNILLMSSETEGLPLVIFEAFACKVPVVSTNAGGIGEAVIHKKTGMISPIKQAMPLADNILQLINDENLRDQIIQNALSLVSERFTLEIMSENYYQLYKNL